MVVDQEGPLIIKRMVIHDFLSLAFHSADRSRLLSHSLTCGVGQRKMILCNDLNDKADLYDVNGAALLHGTSYVGKQSLNVIWEATYALF